MAFLVDDNGDITLIQGDSGELKVNGLETDKNYTVYFAIQDEKRNPIGSEVSIIANNASSVIFSITPSLTNLLKVKKNEDFATYYYGIKVCASGNYEDTLFVGNDTFGSLRTVTVYPKKVEGTING